MSGVIHVVTSLHGDAARIAVETAVRLHDPGRPQLVVIGPRVDGGDAMDDDAERRLGVQLVRLRALGLLELARALDNATVRLRDPVVIHTHGALAAVARVAAVTVRGAYCVHSEHGGEHSVDGAFARLEDRIASRCHVVVFVDEVTRDAALSAGRFQGARVEIVADGSDVDDDASPGAHKRRRPRRFMTGATTRAITLADSVEEYGRIYDELIGPPRPTIDPRSVGRGRRRSGKSRQPRSSS